jgi:hypothetical protein
MARVAGNESLEGQRDGGTALADGLRRRVPVSAMEAAHLAPDRRSIPLERSRDLGLADPVEVADAPVKLVQSLLGGAAISLDLVADCVVRV